MSLLTPVSPASKRCQTLATPTPKGVTSPSPVTTTRRRGSDGGSPKGSLAVLLDALLYPQQQAVLVRSIDRLLCFRQLSISLQQQLCLRAKIQVLCQKASGKAMHDTTVSMAQNQMLVVRLPSASAAAGGFERFIPRRVCVKSDSALLTLTPPSHLSFVLFEEFRLLQVQLLDAA